MKAPQWLERLRERAKKQSQDRQVVNDILDGIVGTGKHARQRKRAVGYWVRKRRIERERHKLRRAVQKRMRANAKKKRDRKRKKGQK